MPPLAEESLEVGASFEAQDPKEQLTSTNSGSSSRESCRDRGNYTRSSFTQPQEQGQKLPGSILGHSSSVQQVTISITRGFRHTDTYTITGNLHAGGGSFMPVLFEILKPLKFWNN